MDFINFFYCFKFNDHFLFDKDICYVITDYIAFVVDLNRNLSFNRNTQFMKFNNQGPEPCSPQILHH